MFLAFGTFCKVVKLEQTMHFLPLVAINSLFNHMLPLDIPTICPLLT